MIRMSARRTHIFNASQGISPFIPRGSLHDLVANDMSFCSQDVVLQVFFAQLTPSHDLTSDLPLLA